MNIEYTSTNEVYFKEREALNEKNDCVVRAIASAFNIDYLKAHSFVKYRFSRKDRGGTYSTYFKMLKLRNAFSKSVTQKYHEEWPTVNQFLKKGYQGTYFILVRGHAFTIIDGVIHGNASDASRKRAKIRGCFKITSVKLNLNK